MPMLTVIGYSSGSLIAISEEGKLFYMKCDESLFEPGTVLEKDDICLLYTSKIQKKRVEYPI